MKIKLSILGLLLSLSLSASAAMYQFQFGTLAGGAPIGEIPDNSSIGFSDSHLLTSMPDTITSVTLQFALKGGFKDDLSGYLRLGNTPTAPAFSLTPTIHNGSSLDQLTPISYTVDVTSAFKQQDPDDTWTLYFADSAPGGVTSLYNWSLDIEAVPEPTTIAGAIFAGLVIIVGLVRRKFRLRTP